MHCLSANKSSFPLSEKSGWPWKIHESCKSANLFVVEKFPKISIITPSYNQGEFLEETIRSVLLQGYPNLEYIIIDGGSSDNSIEIIRKYEPWIDYWISEPDDGQSAAINKGFKRATGEIIAWLNSDDCFNPHILSKIATHFIENQNTRCITCPVSRVNLEDEEICITHPPSTKFLDIFDWNIYIPQAGVFFKKELIEEVGYLDESLHLQMDYDLWFRFSKVADFSYIDVVAARIKIHENAKTSSKKYKALSIREALEVKLRYANPEIQKNILNNLAKDILLYKGFYEKFSLLYWKKQILQLLKIKKNTLFG